MLNLKWTYAYPWKHNCTTSIYWLITIYGSETWTFTRSNIEKLNVNQRTIERRLLGISPRDQRINAWVKERTKVEEITYWIASLNREWAGQDVKQNNIGAENLFVRNHELEKGRCAASRWGSDDIKNSVGLN